MEVFEVEIEEDGLFKDGGPREDTAGVGTGGCSATRVSNSARSEVKVLTCCFSVITPDGADVVGAVIICLEVVVVTMLGGGKGGGSGMLIRDC